MRSPGSVLVRASAAQSSVSLLNFGLPSIGPALRAEFGLSLAELGAVLTASLFGSGIALYAAGVGVDRFGGRRATLAGCAFGAAALAAAAFAPSAAVLIPLMAISGAGLAVVPIAGIGSLFHAYPADRRGWALGVRQMAVPLGGVFGAVLLPVLNAAGSARLAVGFCAVPVAVTGILFAAVAGEAPPGRERPRVGLRTIWGAPGFQRLLVVAAFYIVVLQALLSYTVPAARDAGLSAFAAGAAFFALNVTAGVARIVWGRLADGAGGTRRVPMIVGAGFVAATGGLAFALALHLGTAVAILAVVVFAFGALGWNALVYVAAGEWTPPELAGQAVAVAATLVFIVSAVSTPVLGALAEHAGWDALWLTSAGLAAAGALVATGLGRARADVRTA
jgi:MFS family permease